MKDKKLYQAYKNFIKASLSILSTKIESGAIIPSHHQFIAKKHEGGGHTIQSNGKLKFDYDQFIFSYQKDLIETAEAKYVLDLWKNKGILIDYTDEAIKTANFYNFVAQYLSSFLTEYIKRKEKFEFDQLLFQKLFSELENFFSSDKATYIARTALFGFDSEVSELSLNKSIKIKKMNEDEFEDFWNRVKGGIFNFTIFIIEIEYSAQKYSGLFSINEGNSGVLLEKIISCLRIFKQGLIYKNSFSVEPKYWQPYKGRIILGNPYQFQSPGLKYQIEEREIKELKKFWKQFVAINFNENEALDVAIRRFSFAFERTKNEDKIIDFFIALEALFLRNEEKAELSYRLAIRAAMLVGKNMAEKKMIFQELRCFYDIRSKIVHGNRGLSSADINDAALKVEKYVRNILKEFLNRILNKNHSEILKELDLNLFS